MLNVAAACVTENSNAEEEEEPFALADANDATWGTRAFARYLRFLDHRRRWIIGVWLVLGVGGACAFQPFLATTNVAFQAPPGSEAYVATNAFVAAFPTQRGVDTSAVLVSRKDGKNVTAGAALRRFTVALNASLAHYKPSDPKNRGTWIMPIQGYYSIGAGLPNPPPPAIARRFVNAGATASFLLVSRNTTGLGKDQAAQKDALAFLEDRIAKLCPAGDDGDFTCGATGVAVIAKDILEGVETNATRMEVIAFPLALFVLSLVLRSVRLLLLPVCCIGASLAASFLVMWPVASCVDVISYAPSVQISLGLALSIDYALFIGSRFREETRDRGRAPRASVRTSLATAGHTVLVSGSTIAVCFLGLLGFPLDMISSVGLAASVTVVLAVAAALSLTPALLLEFPSFFSDYRCLGCAPCCPQACRSRWERRGGGSGGGGNADDAGVEVYASLNGDGDGNGHGNDRPGSSSSSSSSSDSSRAATTKQELRSPLLDGDVPESPETPPSRRRHRQQQERGGAEEPADDGPPAAGGGQAAAEWAEAAAASPCWFAVATATQRHRAWVVVLLTAAVVPFALKLKDLHGVQSFALTVPRGSQGMRTYNELTQEFGASSLFPYAVLIEPGPGTAGTVFDTSFFARTQGVLAKIAAAAKAHADLEGTTLQGIMYASGQLPIPYLAYNVSLNTPLKECTGFFPTLAECELARFSRAQLVNAAATATYVNVAVPEGVDVFAPAGSRWIKAFRGALADATRGARDRYWLAKGNVEGQDAVDTVYRLFPTMITVTLACVFLLVGLAFRSVVVPLRAVVTIGMTCAMVYGFAVMVYELGALDWLGLAALHSNPWGMYWISPVLAFSILVGLGVDYDVFLLTRIVEYRAERRAGPPGGGAAAVHGDEASVVLGVTRTGGVITAAGTIMFIAFSGLMLSSEGLLDELAFLLCFSVLLDTFVVRTMLVPALMGLLGKWNWWPRRGLPPVAACDDD